MRFNAPLIALAILASAATIGCSGDDPTPEDTPTETATAEPTLQPTPTATALPTPTATATPTACIDEDGDGVCAGVDCDDTQATVFSGAPELCDDLDNDCDESTDEGLDATFYPDVDGDGFGADTDTIQDCGAPEGYAAVGGDCDDTSRAVYPERRDVCDGEDNDCDSNIDENPDLLVYTDVDSDGYGDDNTVAEACTPESGEVFAGGDCEDNDASINPGAEEIWENDIDEDCDGADATANLYVMKAGEIPPDPEATVFETIGDAIEEAITGVTIGVGPGTYSEAINYQGKDLQIVSIEGPGRTVIDAGGTGPVALFNNAEGTVGTARLEGFTLTGGTGSPGTQCGFSIGFNYGGAICINDASPKIIGNYIHNNSVSGSGGAIYVEGGAALFEDNFIEFNTAEYDAGAVNISNSEATFADNVISNNSCKRTGGGVLVFTSTSEIRNNIITFNQAPFERAAPAQGGGVYINNADPMVYNNVIAYNVSGSSGGGVAVGNAEPGGMIFNNTIVGNEAQSGGGVNVAVGSTTFVGNIVAFNEAPTGANVEIADIGAITTSHNVFWLFSGASGVVGHTMADTDTIGDPAFADDLTDSNGDDDDFSLLFSSAAIDFGDPAEANNDVDGTRNDAGAFGGPFGASFSHTYSEAVSTDM